MEKFELNGQQNHRYEDVATEKSHEISKELIKVVKKFKPTYSEAYMNLKMVYDQLQYESNFVNVD